MSHSTPPTPEELILSMLRDVLARQAKQMGLTLSTTQPAPSPVDRPPTLPTPLPTKILTAAPAGPSPAAALTEDDPPLAPQEQQALAEFEELAKQPFTPSQLANTLRVATLALLIILILINVPIFNGLALARALPDKQALIIRDGLLLKGSGAEVYVLQDNYKRWISSLDAFNYYGYRWDEVHLVEDSFLAQFPTGRPIHILLKCESSPHIYRLENDRKRWIKDISTFTAEGHVWKDVSFVTCDYLRRLPDGPPIPPDAGPPPQP